ncbi:MAG: HNH endonuclease [Actinobacteria bacterium]|nr:HNH endonuclease [Actinomycetota bacterium]
MPYLIGVVVLIVLIGLVFTYWYIVIPLVLIGVVAWRAPRVIRSIRKGRYFASEEFQAHKDAIAAIVAEHNEVADYVSEIREQESFQIGSSATGSQAYLAKFENTSTHNYRRDRNLAEYAASNVHNCSLQVVRNASGDPLKYVMKYFDIKPTEATVGEVELLGESISRLEEAIANLGRREAGIIGSISPPPFIMKYYSDEFMRQVGVDLSRVTVPYPDYVFEYVSAVGTALSGLSSQWTLERSTL